MSRPALKKFFFLSFSVLSLVLLSEKTAWAHHTFNIEPYFTYGIPATILGIFIGCALGRKFPILSSIAGGILGMLVSGTVVSVITDDLVGMYVASIFLFFLSIFGGLVLGLLYRFFRKIGREGKAPLQK